MQKAPEWMFNEAGQDHHLDVVNILPGFVGIRYAAEQRAAGATRRPIVFRMQTRYKFESV
jgi:hypothetical protein